jgi:predicted lysophospholipase L1 biosynthesis ABC-type transport system permease subunit
VFATEDAVPMPLVVNESFDRRYLRAEPLNAVTVARGGGRALRPGQIVGVVGDVVDGGLAAPVSPTVYYRLDLGEHALSLRYLLRAPGEIRPADAQIRRALFAATPESTVASIDTIHGRLGRSMRERTFAALMFTLLALAGGAVAVFGIAGVVAHTVSSRLRYLAIRHVLGARSSDLRRATAGDAILAGASGSLVGFVVSMWLSRWLQSLAYGVEVGSWSEFAAVAVCGVLLVTVAALVPTRRLDRTSLTQVLRQS